MDPATLHLMYTPREPFRETEHNRHVRELHEQRIRARRQRRQDAPSAHRARRGLFFYAIAHQQESP